MLKIKTRVENYTHSPYYAVQGGFAISTNLWARKQSTKTKLKDGSRGSKQATQTLKMKKEGDDHRISITKPF